MTTQSIFKPKGYKSIPDMKKPSEWLVVRSDGYSITQSKGGDNNDN